MNKHESVNKLSNQAFRQLTGVHKSTFEVMKKILETAEQQEMRHGGKPNKLTILERLLMWLEYLREYQTYSIFYPSVFAPPPQVIYRTHPTTVSDNLC